MLSDNNIESVPLSLSIVTVSTGSFIYFCDKDQAILPIITFVDSLSLADGPGAKYIHHSRFQEHSRSLTLIIFPRAKTKLWHWPSAWRFSDYVEIKCSPF